MGGIVPRGSREDPSPWTGGLPKADWSGLDPSEPTRPRTTNQLRPVGSSAAQKGYTHRETGLTTKFARDGDLPQFENHIWRRFYSCGMDTITYVPDPALPTTGMVSIVRGHSRFTVEAVEAQIAPQLLKYDDYDKENDIAASSFLMDSLEGSLEKEVRDVMSPGEPFPETFMRVSFN